MSRRAPSRALLLAALALMGGAPAAQARQTDEAIRARLAELEPLLEQAREEAREARSLRMWEDAVAEAPAVDTFAVGPLKVVALPDQRALATEVFGAVLAEYEPWLSESPALPEYTFVFQWAVEPQPIVVAGPHMRVEGTRFRTRAMMEGQVRQAIGSVLAMELSGTPMGRWFSGAVRVPSDPGTVYRTLAAVPAEVNERCLVDGGTACWTALSLDLDDNPWDDWFSAEQRRQMAESLKLAERIRARRAGVQDLGRACTEEDDQGACDAYLAATLLPEVDSPLGKQDAHPAMLMLALQAGGAGAWTRLTEDLDRSPGEALRYASGLSAEELGDRWQAWVVAQQPESQAGFGSRALWSLFWTLCFAALAMRSTRWRLG